MKNLKLFFITAIFFGITSCSKEEQEVSIGFVKMENKTSDLNYGYIEDIALNPGRLIRIYLSDKQINFVENNKVENLAPRDNYITFFLHYPNLDDQELFDYYPLRTEYENINISDSIPFLLNSAVTFNITATKNEITNSNFDYRNYIWDNGSITIDENITSVRISFTLKKDNRIITGEYNGNLKNISSP